MEDLTTTVSNVGGIAKLLGEYGPYVIMGAIFIIAFIVILALFLKMNNAMLSNVIQQNEKSREFTNTLLNKLIESNKKIEEHHNKDLVTTFIGYRGIFMEAASPILKELGAYRVAIYLFHNGNGTAYGFPFIKTSCIFDINNLGIKTSRKVSHSNIPLHAFAGIIYGLSDDGIHYGNLSDDDLDGSLHQFLNGSDSHSAFMRAIKSKEGIIAGFTVCEFKEEQDYSNKELLDKINEAIKDMNQSIKFIVTNDEVNQTAKAPKE